MKDNFGDSGKVHERYSGKKTRDWGGVQNTGQANVGSHLKGPQQGAGMKGKSSGAKQFRDKG